MDNHLIGAQTSPGIHHVQTALSGAALFPGALEKLAAIQNGRRHPFEFYQKRGYEIVGVIPDANSPETSGILMAKSSVRAGG